MPYNDKSIKRDLDDAPIPQFFNDTIDDYEVGKGRNGASFIELLKSNGAPMELEKLFDFAKSMSIHKTSVSAALSATLDTGLYGGRTVLEIWVKSNLAVNFTVQCSTDGINWRTTDTIMLTEAGEKFYSYSNAYRFIKVFTNTAANNEIEIVSSR